MQTTLPHPIDSNRDASPLAVDGAALRARLGILTPREVAALLGVEERTLALWRTRGTGPDWCSTEGRSRVFYRETDLVEWLAINVVQGNRTA